MQKVRLSDVSPWLKKYHRYFDDHEQEVENYYTEYNKILQDLEGIYGLKIS
jgi:hypothetical protein